MMSRLKNYGLIVGSHTRDSSRPAFLVSRLTAQENQILTLACELFAKPEIASQLQLNEQDVQHSLQRIADKMGLSDCGAMIDYIRRRAKLYRD